MASNYNHNFQVVDDLENSVSPTIGSVSATPNPPNVNAPAVVNREDHELLQRTPPVSAPTRLTGGGRFTGNSQQQIPDDGCAPPNYHQLAYYSRHNKFILNEASLIQNRRINVNHKFKKGLELMCEEKVSKYKLEEVHCSLPSSNKSTFIMTFSPDGQRVASTHGDHRIYICDLNTGKLLDTLEGHPKTPWCLAWHPSNREILASGCLAGEVRVWDLRSKACESWTSENNTIITSLDFHPKERVLVIATSNDIHFWDWSESEPFAKTTTTHDKEKVKFVEFDSSGTKLITGISNLPRFVGYTSDSLQNRIIDSYLTHSSLEQLPTDNMTSDSEISGPIMNQNGSPIMNSSNETINFNERSASRINITNSSSTTNNNESNNISNSNSRSQQQSQAQQIAGTNDDNTITENDFNYRSTLTLSRVAFLYRQLEQLEDAMRHTSFTPYVATRPGLPSSSMDSDTSSSSVTDESTSNNQSPINHQLYSKNHNDNNNTIENRNSSNSNNNNNNNNTDQSIGNKLDKQNSQQDISPPNSQSNSSQQASSSLHMDTQSTSTGRVPHTFEPFVVSFDESLENLHLRPLVVDGQTINPASVVEQCPIYSSHQLHHMMHDSINQVNQNFIRISKLMSSIRLYRQIVQQILTANSGQGPYQPNQILTAQSASPRATRHASNLPIVFRDVPPPMDSAGRGTRSSDPILAIQFRNSARNVPLATICKIDLLSARSLCIMRAQQLIEQVNFFSPRTTNHQENVTYTPFSNPTTANNNEQQQQESSFNPIISPILNRLHQVLGLANHAILTTSNVHSHIASLRSLINKLLNALATMYQTESDGPRIRELILNIAHSLTGRSWNVPLGATLNDIRLDVIHTLCTVDLTLHLTRQVQLIQMQRLSAAILIEESRRGLNRSSANTTGSTSTNINEADVVASSSSVSSRNSGRADATAGPSTSSGFEKGDNSSSLNKRKDPNDDSEAMKRRRIMPESSRLPANCVNSEMRQDNNQGQQQKQQPPSSRSVSTNSSTPDSPLNPNDRLVVWNGGQSSASLEQNLQRFLVATASSMTNSHILVRIYHRSQASPSVPSSNISEQSIAEQRLSGGSPQPQESRRRALSHDNSSATLPTNALDSINNLGGDGVGPTIGGSSSSSSTNDGGGGGGGARRGGGIGVNLIGRGQVYPGSNNPGAPIEGWQRHPHLHVYQTRGTGQHLWFNQWTIPFPVSNSNYRVQCWNFSLSAIPNIKDSQSNVVTQKCRIHNDASIDISSDGNVIACLVPRDDGSCASCDLKIFSLRAIDFGTCYYQLPHGANAISVSLSPSAGYAVVGLANNKIISSDTSEGYLTIAKVFKLGNCKSSSGYVRDIKIKRDDSSLSLNAICWMSRGIVYNVGPQHHQRYQAAATRIRNGIV